MVLTGKSLCQEGHMFLFVRSDLLQVGIEWIFEASFHEIFMGVILETLLIEAGLEMLKCQGIVEDIR